MITKEIDSVYAKLKAIPYVQSFLNDCYNRLFFEESERLSFQNADRFIYYLEHGEIYLKEAQKVPVHIQPVLLFYGLTQLIKACLLTRRPEYPENTKILSHGVSARKRKKQDYSFLHDEVKVQQHGLFPYFSKHLFHTESFPVDKFTMEMLLRRVPEMNVLFKDRQSGSSQIKIGHVHKDTFLIPTNVLNTLHITEQRFKRKMSIFVPEFESVAYDAEFMRVQLEQPLFPFLNDFLYLNLEDEHYYLMRNRHLFFPLHEIMVHYLILYNLSMICRYETEWWGDLLHTHGSEDYSYIHYFLEITQRKVSVMIGFYLYHQIEKNRAFD
ncbi:YaaC family protein [Salirhabdus salicampi]|uniref:YaaC family protein n=1 Tax=Salirhabdus salicampi TaxID=476102 RepID=UPI0020C49FCB|nr:YaaC family protein [Salirhabdus salicampi]MCP8617195.1 YaaC family protein [Salirhabdus salicampi]